MPTGETLRGIREDAEDEFDIDFDHIRRDQCTLIQRQTWDAGYAAGIEAAKQAIPANWMDALLSGPDVPKLPWGCPQIEWFIRRLGERLDALKAVDRG
jgi:hypothetical protein